MVSDESHYELAETPEDDHLPDADGPTAEAQSDDEVPLGPPAPLPVVPVPSELLSRYCPACGQDLSEPGEQMRCPRCDRPFDPGNPATFLTAPPPPAVRNWWLSPPALAGYALLPTLLLGRLIINSQREDWSTRLRGDGHEEISGAIAQAAIAAFSGLMLIPWLIGCAWLALVALDERYNPRLRIAAPLGALLAAGMTLGYPRPILIAALACGAFAGLLRRWQAG